MSLERFYLEKENLAHTEHFTASRVPLVQTEEMVFHIGMQYYSVETLL